MLSCGVFAQTSGIESQPENQKVPLCYLLTYIVHPFQDAACPYNTPGTYILELCPPFYSEYLTTDWRQKVYDYWCEHGVFPQGVRIKSYTPNIDNYSVE